MSAGKGMTPRKGYNQAKYAANYDSIFRAAKQPTQPAKEPMNTQDNPSPLPTILPWHREAAHPDYPGYVFTDSGTILKDGQPVYYHYNKCTGYSRLALTNGLGVKCRPLVHRVILEAFCGYAPADKPLACHRNDVKTDNRIENLYWGDRAANASDAVRNGRVSADVSGRSKLNRAQVAAIRSEYANGGITMQGIADKYGLSQGHVSDICNGKKWRNVA